MDALRRHRKHGEMFGRFRILVVGRANAGKTTILQAVCGTDEKPTIKANKPSILSPYHFIQDRISDKRATIRPSAERGHHEIEDELIFQNNPGLVFHDSQGFESGSAEGLETVRTFISKRAKRKTAKNKLHAIWFCLPTDQDARLITAAELNFFEECDPGSVPVIAIFTKFDSLDIEAYRILRDQGLSHNEARERCSQHAEERFDQIHLPRIQDRRFPPAHIVHLRYMHQGRQHHKLIRQSVNDLIKKTTDTLSPEALNIFLASIQEDSLVLGAGEGVQQHTPSLFCIRNIFA